MLPQADRERSDRLRRPARSVLLTPADRERSDRFRPPLWSPPGRQAQLREGGGFATASEAVNIRAAPKNISAPPEAARPMPTFGKAGASIRNLLAVRKRKKRGSSM